MFGSIRHIPWVGKLLILVGVYLITEFLFIYVSAGIIQVLYPSVNLFDLVADLSVMTSADQVNAEQTAALKLYQAITSLGRFLVVSLVFVYLCGERPGNYLLLNRAPSVSQFLLLPILLLASGVFIGGVQEWNANLHLPAALKDLEATMRDLEDRAQLQTDLFLQVDTPAGLAVNILVVCIIAAMGEEWLFRGVLQQTIYRGTGNAHGAIWISALLFSFIHLQFFGFFPRLLLGAMMGYLLYFSNSIWAPITAHFLNNLITVTGYYLIQTGALDASLKEPAPWWGSLIALPFVFLLLWQFKRAGTTQTLPDGKRLDADLHDTGQDPGELPAK